MLGFWCTLPPRVHPIIVEASRWADICNQPCGNLGDCPWKIQTWTSLSASVQGVHLSKKAVVLRGPLPHDVHFGIKYSIRPTQRWSNAARNIGVISSSHDAKFYLQMCCSITILFTQFLHGLWMRMFPLTSHTFPRITQSNFCELHHNASF